MHSRFIAIVLLVLGGTSPAFAQKKVRVENITGRWILSQDITLVQAKENAIREAKAQALRAAGVTESFGESTIFYKVEENNKYQDVFESIATSDIAGEISSFEIVKEQTTAENDQVIVSVTINADVSVNKLSKDPSLKVDVTGLREVYSSPDKLTFEVNPWKDGYLTVFILAKDESGQLFPNYSEKQELLQEGRKYSFPKSKSIDYEVSTNVNVEVNYIVLLFTKNEVKFRDDPSDQNILKFLASISPAEKFVKTHSILIKRNSN
jgi:hypothetical protein